MVQLLILYCLKYISGVLLVILISVASNFDGPLSGVHDCKEHADNVHCADRDKAHDILSGEQLYKDVGDGAAALVHSCELCALFNCAYAGAQSCCPCHSLVGDPDGHCHDGTAGNQSTEEVALVDSDCNGDEESDLEEMIAMLDMMTVGEIKMLPNMVLDQILDAAELFPPEIVKKVCKARGKG